jgi:hypothetical protein
MRADDFSSTLVQAVRTMGSLLEVALLLEVEPRQVYRWMAELDRPSGARLVELRARLRVASAG